MKISVKPKMGEETVEIHFYHQRKKKNGRRQKKILFSRR
jgi:hypothetical protein